MSIGVFGINYKQADVALREKLCSAFQRRFFLISPIPHSVLIATCNRVELYFSGPQPSELHQNIISILRTEISEDFEQKCYSFFGRDCFWHLARVTAGLDSAIAAETEIQGQVKNAYEQAKNSYTLSSELHYLFQRALHVGKTTRSRYFQGKNLPDMEHAILHMAHEFFADTLPPLLFIGASEINIKIARFLQRRNVCKLFFCNRTESKVEELKQELNISIVPWNMLETRWEEFHWIIAGAKSLQHLIRPRPCLHETKRLLIDLAVPRNIHPKVAGKLYNIDELQQLLVQRKTALEESLQQAEKFIALQVALLDRKGSKPSYTYASA